MPCGSSRALTPRTGPPAPQMRPVGLDKPRARWIISPQRAGRHRAGSRSPSERPIHRREQSTGTVRRKELTPVGSDIRTPHTAEFRGADGVKTAHYLLSCVGTTDGKGRCVETTITMLGA